MKKTHLFTRHTSFWFCRTCVLLVVSTKICSWLEKLPHTTQINQNYIRNIFNRHPKDVKSLPCFTSRLSNKVLNWQNKKACFMHQHAQA